MIQRFSSLSVHEKQACFPGCPFFVFFLKSIIAETFPHLYTNGALSFYFLFPIIEQDADKCKPFFTFPEVPPPAPVHAPDTSRLRPLPLPQTRYTHSAWPASHPD